MRRATWLRAALVTAVAVAAVACAARRTMARVEEPAFESLGTVEGLELRRYRARVIAETEVSGGFREGLNEGFRRIAGYIFGGNEPRQKVAMTAPVALEGGADHWTVSFFMPAAFRMETLPRPLDGRVRLRALGEGRVAVLSFRGRADEALVAEKRRELEERMARAGLRAAGPVSLAQYNPPWTLGPFRRNELVVPLAE